MARRSSGRSMRSAPVRSVAPRAPTQVQPVVVTQGKQPGLLANVASTAAGVAIGHTVAHGLTNAIYGSSSSNQPQVEQSAQPQQQQFQQNQKMPCQYELQQFLNCTQQQSDLSLCEGFNQIFKECKLRFNNV